MGGLAFSDSDNETPEFLMEVKNARKFACKSGCENDTLPCRGYVCGQVNISRCLELLDISRPSPP